MVPTARVNKSGWLSDHKDAFGRSVPHHHGSLTCVTSENPTPSTPAFNRRSVTRGAAWAVPVALLSVPAPAFAVSCAGMYDALLDWGVTPYTRTSATIGSATVTPTGGPPADLGTVVVDFTSVFNQYAATTDFEDANLPGPPEQCRRPGSAGPGLLPDA